MRILEEKISREELLQSGVVFGGPMVKGVVDGARKIIAIDAELHADLEQFLLGDGSKQENLWGINLYPEETDDFIEYDSMINIRPRQNNRSREVEDPEIRAEVAEVVRKWVQ